MAKLRKFMDFFVTIEGEEGAEAKGQKAPEQAEAKKVGEIEKRGGGTLAEDGLSEADRKLLAEMEQELSAPGPAAQRSGQGAQQGVASRSSDSGAPRRSLDEPNAARRRSAPKLGADLALGIELGDASRIEELIGRTVEEIYEGAGLPAVDSDAFTIHTVRELLDSEHLRGLPTSTRRASLMVAMQARGVGVEQVIEDAFQRDEAIDQHDAELAATLRGLEAEIAQKNESIQREMERLLEEMRGKVEANNAALDEARHAYQQWRGQKQAEEQLLYDAVAPFVRSPDENPVSVDN